MSHRTFKTTWKRKQTYLDGVWDVTLDPNDQGLVEDWPSQFPAASNELWVPGVWNTHAEWLNYEGAAWYRKRFQVEACAAVALDFGGVTHQANVWLDGEPLGEHYGGFLPFHFLSAGMPAGEHELIVRVDNTHDMEHTIPLANLDWFRYGGIHRPVWVEELSGPGLISSWRLSPVVRGGKVQLGVRAELTNLTDSLLEDTWTLSMDGIALRTARVRLAAGDAQVLRFVIDIPEVELWSPENPRLHEIRLAYAGDDQIDRVGFREIKLDGPRVLLNGQPLQIRGVNRHEDHPDWGLALPEHLMLRDLDLLDDLHGNAIRGSHYPNDPRFLDLCDERGILFIEEIPLWGFTQEQLASEAIINRASAMVWAMIERDLNHPCVWAWSLLNECATETPEGQAAIERLAETARELDPTRPVTFASNRALEDICFSLADVICVNAYHGWYTHDTTWMAYLDKVRARIGDKPLIVSEFGAGAIYGWHAREEGVIWSEEYQKEQVTSAIAAFLRREDLLGFYIWQFFDTRTDTGHRALMRPRNYNNKGLLDEYRRPKLAYYAVRDLMSTTQKP